QSTSWCRTLSFVAVVDSVSRYLSVCQACPDKERPRGITPRGLSHSPDHPVPGEALATLILHCRQVSVGSAPTATLSQGEWETKPQPRQVAQPTPPSRLSSPRRPVRARSLPESPR